MLPDRPDERQRETPHIPDVSGCDCYQAALKYAEAGFYILPVKNPKNPGSIVGKGWPDQSTQDPDVIESYWDRHPRAGIAVHTGKSNIIAFDLDVDVIPDELAWLRAGVFQSSRGGRGERGHYVFASDEFFVSGDIKLDGTKVADIRSANTVIIAEPSPHAKADDGGQYLWTAHGALPRLPDAARQYVRVLGTTKAGVWSAGFEASDELVAEALSEWTANARPRALDGPVNKIRRRRDSTYATTRNALRFIACEARVGFYPLATAVEKVRAAMIESYEQRGEDSFSDSDFGRLIKNGVGYALSRSPKEILDEADRDYGEDTREKPHAESDAVPIFCVYSPEQWAQPVAPTEFLIRQVLCRDTWGVNGGPEKSLKTHDNQAIAMAVATGINLYKDGLLPVQNKGKVLYIVGEGGSKQVFRVLHRMCRAYGISPTDVAKDPDFPLHLAFGAAPLDSERLRDELKALLDRYQPDLVLMESFYNFHPAQVSAANLYERGQVIDSYHKLVREGGTDVVSLLTDHNKKGANDLGLRHISMSGQAENSDSWIQRKHREDPDVQTGEFKLTTSFNGRDWGGSIFDVDWHLGSFDHNAGCHIGDISWTVSASTGQTASTSQAVKMRQDILDLIRHNDFKLIRKEICDQVSYRKDDVLKEIKSLVHDGLVQEGKPSLYGRTDTTAKVLGLAPVVMGLGTPVGKGSNAVGSNGGATP